MPTRGLNSAIVADAFLASHSDIVSVGRNFHVYTGSHFESIQRPICLRRVTEFVRQTYATDDAHSKLIEESLLSIQHRTAIGNGWQPFWRSNPDKTASVLVVNNGIVDLTPIYDGNSVKLLPHTPHLFATTKSDFDYDPAIKTCRNFEEFLVWFTCGDSQVQKLLLQFIAYILLRDLDLQKFLILSGQGSNGKSTFLKLIQLLLGEGNYTAIPIERLGQQFALQTLFNKAANICGDMNETDKVSEGNLKMLADYSTMRMEQKYQDPFDAVAYVRLIFACNMLPRFRDRTDGLWRRIFLVLCMAVVPDDAIVRDIEKTFNLSGVLNLVIEAAKELIELGDFILPEAVVTATRKERLEMNPTRTFLIEHTTCEPNAEIPIEVFFSNYRVWMENNNYHPLAANNFGKELQALYCDEFKSGLIKKGKTKAMPRKLESGRIVRCKGETKTTPRKNCYRGLKFWPNGVQHDELSAAQKPNVQPPLFDNHESQTNGRTNANDGSARRL